MKGLFFLLTILLFVWECRGGVMLGRADDGYERILERIRGLLELSLVGEEAGNGDGVSGEEVAIAMEYFEELLKKPLPINAARRVDLERLLFLSPFQIESIINYRSTSGDILSASELSLLHGFDEQMVSVISPFLSFEPTGGIAGAEADGKLCRHQIYFKTVAGGGGAGQTIGTPLQLQLRYKGELYSRVSWGVTLENDNGELLFPKRGAPVDFISINMSIKNRGTLNSLIVGDYSARFGQGLVLWNSFNMAGVYGPGTLYKSGASILPYSSSDESNFLRGVASSFSFGKFNLNLLFSLKSVDARIKNGAYTSIVTGGVHNTLSLLECRKSMQEYLGGATLSYLFKKIKIGLSAAAYGYDKKNGVTVKEYNRYQIYNGIWGNASIDFYGVWGNLRLFGEFAADLGGSGAFLIGSLFPVGSRTDMGILLRSYSKSYIAPHASAYSTLSTVSNQRGATVSLVTALAAWARLSGYSEMAYYPWHRYNVNGSSYMFKESLRLDIAREMFDGYVNLSHTFHSHTNLHKLYGKARFNFNISERSAGILHSAFVVSENCGYEFGGAYRFKSRNRRFGANGGGAFFNCREWESRLYIYEQDLPYTYANRLLYGCGISAWLLLDYEVSPSLRLYLKNGTLCHFNDDRESQYQLKFGAKLNF